MAGVSLILPIVPAILFNQMRIVFITFALGLTLLMSEGYPYPMSRLTIGMLPSVLAIEITALTYMRERGFFNRYGLKRFLMVLLPIGILYLFEPAFANSTSLFSEGMARLFLPTHRLPVPFGTVFISVVSIALLWRLRGTEYPILGSCFAAVILFVLQGISPPLEVDAPGVARVFKLLCFSLSGLMFLWCIYLLSWGRAYCDELTELPGRRALEEQLLKLGDKYSIVMLDIDHFKKFNDTYGHQTGDDVLRLVAKTLRSHCGENAYRFGGEEFTIIQKGRGMDTTASSMDHLRRKIQNARLTIKRTAAKSGMSGKVVKVTASFGVADSNGEKRLPHEVLRAADSALYKAKKLGRNRVAKETRSYLH